MCMSVDVCSGLVYYVWCIWIKRLFDSYIFCFFFFKQKTAYEMRISDWSSDVCSSDLWKILTVRHPADGRRGVRRALERRARRRSRGRQSDEIGRASCRERVCQYV